MDAHSKSSDVGTLEFDPTRGFLPSTDPFNSFGPTTDAYLQRLDRLCESLPSLIDDGRIRETVRALDPPKSGLVDSLAGPALRALYVATGVLANAFVHSEATSGDVVPAGVAIPLYESATRLKRTPVLSYDGYVLSNWTLDDPDLGFVPHNVDVPFRFTDLRDEQWFVAIHVAVEAMAAPAIEEAPAITRAMDRGDTDRLIGALGELGSVLEILTDLITQMPEHNDPDAFTTEFRPYLTPLRDVAYEGVTDLDGPQTFRGASGAQSGLFVAFDALIGIDHGTSPLTEHIDDLLADVPRPHRRFIDTLEAGRDVSTYCRRSDCGELRAVYNDCIDRLTEFRERHVEIVERYLGEASDGATGTGGTPYAAYLREFIDNTASQRL